MATSEANRKAWIEARALASGLPRSVLDAFTALGDAQRGAPEGAMVQAQHALGGGVLTYAIEHVGDLTHRMTHDIRWCSGAGEEYVAEKVGKILRSLRHSYGFGREHAENMSNNADYFERANGIDPADYRKRVDKALALYVAEHSKLPVYNEAQYHAREAAIAMGKKMFNTAERHLAKLEKMLASQEGWEHHAKKYQTNEQGQPVLYVHQEAK